MVRESTAALTREIFSFGLRPYVLRCAVIFYIRVRIGLNFSLCKPLWVVRCSLRLGAALASISHLGAFAYIKQRLDWVVVFGRRVARCRLGATLAGILELLDRVSIFAYLVIRVFLDTNLACIEERPVKILVILSHDSATNLSRAWFIVPDLGVDLWEPLRVIFI